MDAQILDKEVHKLCKKGKAEVLLCEQTGKYYKTKGIVGCRYEQTDIPDYFREACGNYKVVNEKFQNMKCKSSR